MPHHSPEPIYRSTIPSIHDDTTLDFRIYHPDVLSQPRLSYSEGRTEWKKRGIVMAHPYAPMGGSYDDRVVGIVAEEFLKAGWVVGTFNFRGAQGSKGRTSWSGKPEVDDYISFAAFFMHYMSYLKPFPTPDTSFTPDVSPMSPPSNSYNFSQEPLPESPVVILGGYSYGSLILKHLPPVPSTLQPFSTALRGSAAEEVVLRAHKLADQSNLEWINLAKEHERERDRRGRTHDNKLSLQMGGEETRAEKRRTSREIRRSLEGSRSLELGRKLRSLSVHRQKHERPTLTPPDSKKEPAKPVITMPSVGYLLISPLATPISAMAAPALSLGQKLWNRSKEGEGQEIIGKYVSFAVYGDQDVFSSVRKTRDWAERLRSEHGSRFESVEIAGAGHFWHEVGVEEKLRDALRDWEGRIR